VTVFPTPGCRQTSARAYSQQCQCHSPTAVSTWCLSRTPAGDTPVCFRQVDRPLTVAEAETVRVGFCPSRLYVHVPPPAAYPPRVPLRCPSRPDPSRPVPSRLAPAPLLPAFRGTCTCRSCSPLLLVLSVVSLSRPPLPRGGDALVSYGSLCVVPGPTARRCAVDPALSCANPYGRTRAILSP